MHYRSTLVSLREAYNHIGMLEHVNEWTGEEARSITPGKRQSFDPQTWRRGRHVWSIMMQMIEAESLAIIIHMNGCRVRYGTTAIPHLTNLYPCPTNDPDVGFIELGDQEICYATADVSRLPKLKSKPKAPPGPKLRFGDFLSACLVQFREFGLHQSSAEIRLALNALKKPPHPWPKKTREKEIIDEAREQVRAEMIGNRNAGRTANGAL